MDIELITNDESYRSKIIINAAGLYADEINNIVCNNKFNIIPRKVNIVYLIKPWKYGNKTIFQFPTKIGKGVLSYSNSSWKFT